MILDGIMIERTLRHTFAGLLLMCGLLTLNVWSERSQPDSETEKILRVLSSAPKAQIAPTFQTLSELAGTADPFLGSYFSYTEMVEVQSRRELARAASKSRSFLRRLVSSGMDGTFHLVSPRVRKARSQKEARQARKLWEKQYKTYRKAAVDRLKTLPIDKSRTAVVVSKSGYLAYLVDLDKEVALLYLPIAYGANPYGEEKLRFGDCRTPSSENARIVSKVPISRDDMNGYWIGVEIPVPGRPGAYWSRGGNMGLHGTPYRSTLGTKASHGCVRMYREDSKLLARYVQVGTPVVIWP